MRLRTLLLFLVITLGILHLIWYFTSTTYIDQPPPKESMIEAFHRQPFKKFDTNVHGLGIEQRDLNTKGFRIHMDILEYGKGYPTVVFVPGTGVYAQFYKEFMESLRNRGFNVIGFDPRGHGRSSGPRGDYSLNELVDDALAVVAYARERFGWNVSIAGSSQGGIVAFYAAARDETLVTAICHNMAVMDGKDNLVLSSLKLPDYAVSILERVMPIYKNFAVPLTLYLDLSKEKLKGNIDVKTYMEGDPLCVRWITVRALQSLLKTDLPQPVEEITVPVMLIHSDGDNIFPREYVEGIYDRLTCRKNYFLLKGAEHLVTTNNVPEIIDPITGWLRAITNY